MSTNANHLMAGASLIKQGIKALEELEPEARVNLELILAAAEYQYFARLSGFMDHPSLSKFFVECMEGPRNVFRAALAKIYVDGKMDGRSRAVQDMSDPACASN